MIKEVKEGIMTMLRQTGTINKETKIMKKDKMEIMEWKCTINEFTIH